MRSIVLDTEIINQCGICGESKPYIEYKEIDGVQFIWCKKCRTITFFNNSHFLNNKKKQMIEKEFYFHHLPKDS